jgi:hypothetical protein
MKLTTVKSKVVAASAAVVVASVIAITASVHHAHEENERVREQVILAQNCYRSMATTISTYVEELSLDPSTATYAQAEWESLMLLNEEAYWPPQDSYGVFAEGKTSDEYCSQLRDILLGVKEQWQMLPPPSPSLSPSPSTTSDTTGGE